MRALPREGDSLLGVHCWWLFSLAGHCSVPGVHLVQHKTPEAGRVSNGPADSESALRPSNCALHKLLIEWHVVLQGPFMVFMTFMQTVGIVLQVPRIKLPPELRELMTALNIFNFNLVRPPVAGVAVPADANRTAVLLRHTMALQCTVDVGAVLTLRCVRATGIGKS